MTGRHHLCGDKDSPVVILEESKDFDGSQAKTEDQPEDSFQQQGEPNLNLFPTVLLQTRQGRFSTEEFSMAVISVSVSALIIGFIAGFLVSRHCVSGHENHFRVPYLNKPEYEENIYAKVDDLTYHPAVTTSHDSP